MYSSPCPYGYLEQNPNRKNQQNSFHHLPFPPSRAATTHITRTEIPAYMSIFNPPNEKTKIANVKNKILNPRSYPPKILAKKSHIPLSIFITSTRVFRIWNPSVDNSKATTGAVFNIFVQVVVCFP